MKRAGFVVLLLFALHIFTGCSRSGPPVNQQEAAKAPVKATASVDRAIVSTDEDVTFSVLVDHEKSIQSNLPEIGSRLSGFRVTDFGGDEKKDEDGNRKSVKKWFRLHADVSGSYVLPEIEIPYTHAGKAQSVKTSEIFVEVKSPTETATPSDDDLRDIKDLERNPISFLAWGLSGILILGMAVGIYAWKKMRNKDVPHQQSPPHEVALTCLDELTVPSGADPASLKRFYFQVSAIVRVYVEARFGLRATDMTSEEIVRNLKVNSPLPETEKPIFLDLLEETDLVKFTDFHPTTEASAKIREGARTFVYKTKPVEVLVDSERVV